MHCTWCTTISMHATAKNRCIAQSAVHGVQKDESFSSDQDVYQANAVKCMQATRVHRPLLLFALVEGIAATFSIQCTQERLLDGYDVQPHMRLTKVGKKTWAKGHNMNRADPILCGHTICRPAAGYRVPHIAVRLPAFCCLQTSMLTLCEQHKLDTGVKFNDYVQHVSADHIRRQILYCCFVCHVNIMNINSCVLQML